MKCLAVVAHPDDETIWMGGLIIRHRDWRWHVLSLCRADDPDRAPRFRAATREMGALGCITDLDDSPVPALLSADLHEIKERVRAAVPPSYDLVFTHGPHGEYTRHERHEQVHRAVSEMVASGELTGELLTFTYGDCGGKCRPRVAQDAQIKLALREDECLAKRHIIRDVYGFAEGSFEFEVAGAVEGFSAHGSRSSVARLRRLLAGIDV